MARIAAHRKPVSRKPAPTQPGLRQTIGMFTDAYKTHWLTRLVTLWLAAYLIALSVLLKGILNSHNYIEIFPEELKIPALMYAFIALMVAVSIFWVGWLKSFSAKLMSVILLALLLTGYDGDLQGVAAPLRAFVPGLGSSDSLTSVSLVYLLMLYGIAVAVGVMYERLRQKQKWLRQANVQLGLAVFVGWLFVVPAFSISQVLPTLIAESQVQAPTFTKPVSAAAVKDKPDIYYLVFDRYTNNTVLKEQFGYDNSPFTGFLRDNGFVVDDDAYSHYPATALSVASTMTADYTNKLVSPFKNNSVQSRVLYHNLVWQSSVVKALKQDGYTYYNVGSWYGTSNRAPLADRDYAWDRMLTIFGTQVKLRDIEATEFAQSPLRRFFEANISWSPVRFEERDKTAQIKSQLDTLDDIATKEKPGGRFIFAHILLPHDPFQFNADGSLSAYQDMNSLGKPIKQKYVDQLQFTNTQLREMVEKIKQQSGGNAVVIINADEGPYPQSLNETFRKPAALNLNYAGDGPVGDNMLDWPTDWLQMKYGILQAVHIPLATEEDIAHMSSANVFRIVLNRYLGYNLDYLPECHFGLPSGNKAEYLHADLTDRLKANPDPACKDFATSP